MTSHAAAILVCRLYLISKKLYIAHNSSVVCVHSSWIRSHTAAARCLRSDKYRYPKTSMRTLTQMNSRSQPLNRIKAKQTINRVWGEASVSIDPSCQTRSRQYIESGLLFVDLMSQVFFDAFWRRFLAPIPGILKYGSCCQHKNGGSCSWTVVVYKLHRVWISWR